MQNNDIKVTDKQMTILKYTCIALAALSVFLTICMCSKISHRTKAIANIGTIVVKSSSATAQATVNTASASAKPAASGDASSSSTSDDEEILSFLNRVYPKTFDLPGENPVEDRASIMTARCQRYQSAELDYDPVYQTQDCYTAIKNPNSKIERYSKIPNAYKVSWSFSNNEKQTVVLVLVKENGTVLIDNFYSEKDNSMLFDYTKEPVSIWE